MPAHKSGKHTQKRTSYVKAHVNVTQVFEMTKHTNIYIYIYTHTLTDIHTYMYTRRNFHCTWENTGFPLLLLLFLISKPNQTKKPCYEVLI